MSEINDLRERVEAAEERFGLLDEQQRHYSERVIGLIETIEAKLADARGEIEKQIAENRRLGQENEELRGMLHSVLRSIEEKTFTRTLQNLEERVSALVSGATARSGSSTAATAANRPVQADESPVEDQAVIDALVEADPVGEEAGDEAVILEAGETDAAAGAETVIDEAAEEEMNGDQTAPVAGEMDSAMAEKEDSDAATAMPDHVTFEDAASEEIAAEDSAADETEAIGFEATSAEAEMPEETAPEAESDDGPDAAGWAEGPTAEESESLDAAGETPELADELTEEAAAEAEPETTDNPLFEAIAKRLEGEVPEELAENVAPTVKEIIRRVGDLARELERAEAARQSSRAQAEASEPDADGGGDHPELNQAANA